MGDKTRRKILRRGPSPQGLKILMHRFMKYCDGACKCFEGQEGYAKDHHNVETHAPAWLSSLLDKHIDILVVEMSKDSKYWEPLLKLVNEEVARRFETKTLL